MRRMILASVVSLVLASPGHADEWPSAGGFDVAETDTGCVLSGQYVIAGRPDVNLILGFDGDELTLAITSSGWSRPEGEINARYVFSGTRTVAYTGGLGFAYGDQNGFTEIFEPEMLDHFAASNALLVHRGELVVAHFGLDGSSAATATLRRCTTSVLSRNAAQARREQAFDYIAEDPFAASSANVAGKPVRPPVITNPTWARQPSPTYPDAALERGLSGSADLSCTINPNGSVTNCSIVSETPVGVGFGRAALTGARAARLSPRSVDDVAPGGTVLFTQRFNLAE